ncbi:MAG: type IV toxin-antitoxin system AbiEi family antitoxin domain-containing protein [Caldisericia bacterium]
MKLNEYLEFFKKYYYKKLFTLNDISIVTGISKKILSVELNRLVKKNLIERISKNIYINPFNKPSIDEISMFLKYPSYISMEYALFIQNIMSQALFSVTLITTQYPYEFHYGNYSFEYHHIKKELFFGYYELQPNIYYAYPEKALLDLIYIRYKKGKTPKIILESLINDLYLNEMKKEMLIEFANRMKIINVVNEFKIFEQIKIK